MIKIALIGAGVIGRIHTRNVSHSATCSLAHVVDIDRGRAGDRCASGAAHGGGRTSLALTGISPSGTGTIDNLRWNTAVIFRFDSVLMHQNH